MTYQHKSSKIIIMKLHAKDKGVKAKESSSYSC